MIRLSETSDAPVTQTEPRKQPIRQREHSPIEKRQRENKILAQHSSNSREHYTPRDVIEACSWLMNGIDLDPASTSLANTVVGAKRIYTVQDDGLLKPWYGKAYLNPPGGDTAKVRPELQELSRSYPCIWWARLVSDWQAKRVEQACFMIFQLNLLQAVQKMDGLALTFFDFPMVVFKDRLQYLYPLDTNDGLPRDGTVLREGKGPPGGSALVWLPPLYTGDFSLATSDRFVQVFKHFGKVTISMESTIYEQMP